MEEQILVYVDRSTRSITEVKVEGETVFLNNDKDFFSLKNLNGKKCLLIGGKDDIYLCTIFSEWKDYLNVYDEESFSNTDVLFFKLLNEFKLKTMTPYRHFKGDIYFVHSVSIHTETKETMVTYQALYPPYTVYTRPYDMFISYIDPTRKDNITGQMHRLVKFEESLKNKKIIPIEVNK